MVSRGKSRDRIEPSFDEDREDEDFRLDADDRVIGSRPARTGAKRASAKAKRGKPASPRGRKARDRGGFGLGRLIYWGFVFSIWCGIGIVGLVAYYGSQMPSASSWTIPERPPNMKIVSVEGTVIANRGATGGEALPLEEMSPFIPQAVMAIEDRRFYSHFGVDPLGLARAVVTNVSSGRAVQGGSTLTQQLAKNLFLSPERTIERKVQEVLLAFWQNIRATECGGINDVP